MTNLPSCDDLLSLVQALLGHCRRYDPSFDQRAPSYSGSPYSLSLDGIPEAEVARVADGLGHPMSKPIDLGYGADAPTIYASCYISIGSLSILLCSHRRPATHDEITAAMIDIHRRVVPGTLSRVPSPPSAPIDAGATKRRIGRQRHDSPPLYLTYDDLNRDERKVLSVLRRAGEPLKLRELAHRAFLLRPTIQLAVNRVRNALRRLVREGMVGQVGRGEYELATARAIAASEAPAVAPPRETTAATPALEPLEPIEPERSAA